MSWNHRRNQHATESRTMDKVWIPMAAPDVPEISCKKIGRKAITTPGPATIFADQEGGEAQDPRLRGTNRTATCG